LSILLSQIVRPSRPTLFPYTTLFRSVAEPQPEPLPEQLPVEAEPVAAEAPPAEEMPAAAVATPEPEAASEPAEPEVEEPAAAQPDRKSTRLNSSHLGISYAVFCLKKK